MFKGHATIRAKGNEALVLLSINMEKGELEAELPDEALPDEAITIREGVPDTVIVSNVEIPVPTGTLTAKCIPDVIMGVSSSVNRSAYTTPISTALNLVGDRSGTKRFTLSPNSRFIKFRHEPPMPGRSELYFLNNFIDQPPITITSHGLNLVFHPRKQRSLSISSTNDLRPYANRLATSWSILQGAEVSHTASFTGSDFELSVRRPRSYNRGHSLYRGNHSAAPLTEALTNFFLEMDDNTYSGWQKATRFYLEGINSDLDYDLRIVNFMVVLEMFDNSRTMTKQSIAETFGTSIEFADLLVRMRNRMIHGRMSLWNAIPIVHGELVHHQPGWSCDEIQLNDSQYEMGSILFFLHLQKIVNTFIVKQCAYSGSFDDCTALIRNIEKKMGLHG